MKKTDILRVILYLIFLVIFNAVFFVLGGFDHRASVWISYGFIHFAYFMLLLTPALVRKGQSAALFGLTLYSIASFYFLLEFATGVILILISPEGYKAALLIQLCIAGLYGIILIVNMIANEHTGDAEEERKYQIAYVKDASVKLKTIMGDVRDREAKKKIEGVYDAMYASPVKSHPNLASMEKRILESIDELGDAVFSNNKEAILSLSDTLLAAIRERNMRLKSLN